jgi:uncharacterized SAM-dependent methyltransferase
MFLGSNTKFFPNLASIFRQLRSVMNPNDRLFIGFDAEDPVIVKAKDDSQGVTAAFNLNRRINNELGDFDR